MHRLIRDLKLHNFRSYEDAHFEDLGMLNIFVGLNAAGKTNIIEAIQLLTALDSFRHSTIEQLIRFDTNEARASAHIEDGDRQFELDLLLQPHSRVYKLNGKKKKIADLKGLLPSVTFTPDDLKLVKGSMGGRRRALDLLGSQLSRSYYLVEKDYEKILAHKNKFLKEMVDYSFLGSINETFIRCASQLEWYRYRLIDRLKEPLARYYSELSPDGEDLTLEFHPCWQTTGPQDDPVSRETIAEKLHELIESKLWDEVNAKRSLLGPQIDRIDFLINKRPISDFGSQGQQRCAVLAYKFSEAEIIENTLDIKPILLLDDVMSELDEARREALINFLKHDTQTFITTANMGYFDSTMIERACVWSIPF